MKLKTKITSGTIVLSVIAMALVVPGALAQTSPAQNASTQTTPPQTTSLQPTSDLKPIQREATDIIKGEGAIVDTSGGLLKGHYNIALVSQSDGGADTGTEQYAVKNGQFIISNNDFSDAYKVNPSSWTVTKDQNGYTASGTVTGQDGSTYNVSLTAKLLREIRNGALYEADGTFSDNSGQIYDLHYISQMVEHHTPLLGS